jgi:solute carrier family 35 (UDP-sugar transporter), member A1/2/3
VGVLAVTGACFSSAFAGVYFEKVLAPEKAYLRNSSNKKLLEGDLESAQSISVGPSKKEPPSLWIRNMQLAFFSMIFAYLQGCYERSATMEASMLHSLLDDEKTAELDERPFLHGFTMYVWLLVAIQACGGLLVAAVMKYADNVLKGLAMGVGVVVASVLSTILFDVQLSRQFALGGAIIFASVYCFSNDLPCCCALQSPSLETDSSRETAIQ